MNLVTHSSRSFAKTEEHSDFRLPARDSISNKSVNLEDKKDTRFQPVDAVVHRHTTACLDFHLHQHPKDLLPIEAIRYLQGGQVLEPVKDPVRQCGQSILAHKPFRFIGGRNRPKEGGRGVVGPADQLNLRRERTR